MRKMEKKVRLNFHFLISLTKVALIFKETKYIEN
jgi:hypothetical protein